MLRRLLLLLSPLSGCVTVPPTVAPALSGGGLCVIGRADWTDPAGPRMAWPGTTLRASFTGTRLTLRLHELDAASYRGKHVDNYYDVEVDARPPVQLATTGLQTEYLIADDLAAGAHTVTLIKRTEANMGTVQFLGLGLAPDGQQLSAPCALGERRLELIGDSTTVGYGIEAKSQEDPGCAAVDAMSNVRLTAGVLAAQALHAEAHVLAFSGRGALRNGNPNDTRMLASMLERSLPNDANAHWDWHAWQPHAVVINLGANDLKAEPPLTELRALTTAYQAFVAQVRAMRPTAQLFLAVSPTLHEPLRHAMRMVVAAVVVVHPEATVIDFDEDDGSRGLGCDRHPNAATQAHMAEQLTTVLRARLGW